MFILIGVAALIVGALSGVGVFAIYEHVQDVRWERKTGLTCVDDLYHISKKLHMTRGNFICSMLRAIQVKDEAFMTLVREYSTSSETDVRSV